ncbi:tektin-2 [Microplitis demolitor]|uniref:tektin-2 n=1 Tax=Microplitis demolitor TaxID=69319 RepID=UPI0004CD8057|nr:tektin-2 [Microplitis demolitor]
MAKSVTVYEKPTPHLGLPDWYAKQWELEQSANNRITDSFELRNTARTLRNETKIRTEWDTSLNNTRLDDRVKELSKWEETASKLLNELSLEKKRLRDERAEAEKDLDSIQHPLKVAAECISMRDCRRGTELTYDEPDTELKKELTVIEGLKKTLTDKVQAAWEKLNRLEEIEFKVNLDLQDKVEAIEIDKDNCNLNRNSAIISYKPNALRIPKDSKTYDTWLEHCRYIKNLAENELKDAHTFRDIMSVMRKRARNDMEAQQDASDYALRKRIHQTQKSRNEMQWQKQKVQNELELLEKEIHRLENALINKIDIIKCAETRLENRTYRPGYELCRDEAEFGLKDEVMQLRQTKEELLGKINCSKATFNRLEQLLIQIDRNLDDKQHSLMTDIKCLDMRSSLKTGSRTRLANETDRNIILTNLEDEIPFES